VGDGCSHSNPHNSSTNPALEESLDANHEQDFYEEVEFGSPSIPSGSSNWNPDMSSSSILRRTSRVSKPHRKVDDYIFEGKYKFRVERVVNYSHLRFDVKCFMM